MLEPQAALDNSTDTCEICRGIWSCFLNPATSAGVSLGYADDPLPPRCPGHSPLFLDWRDNSKAEILDAFDATDSGNEEGSSGTEDSENGASTGADRATHEDGINNLTVETHKSSRAVILNRRITMGIAFSQQVIMLKRASVPGHPGIGIRLDPDWVDLELAGKWKQKCLEEHGTKCNNPLMVSPIKPLWVVDVEGECIVPGRDCAAFVALSYRWGSHSWPRVDREMLSTIRKPGALATAGMAPIIRHAMSLTSAIGERYLWVDALCVIQDDSAETLHQLDLMGAFYANALITIVVADGDSAAGIPGIKGVSSSRRVKQTLVPFGEENLMCPDFEIRLGEYRNRGWTYQEYIMSQRRLIFAGDRMHWVCRCCHWHEEVAFGSEFHRGILGEQPEPDLILRGLPDLKSLRELVANYNSRSFSYEEDVIPGISGLLSLLSRSFQGGFLCGLPEMFFDRALGWCAADDLRRRKPSGRPVKDQLPHPLGKLPSWSWAGWQGRISDGRLEPTELFEIGSWVNHGAVEETIPITCWFTSHSSEGAALRKISSTWYENRDSRYKDPARPLPEGWTRRDAVPPSARGPGFWRPPGCYDYLFEHRLFPKRHWCKSMLNTASIPSRRCMCYTPPSLPSPRDSCRRVRRMEFHYTPMLRYITSLLEL